MSVRFSSADGFHCIKEPFITSASNNRIPNPSNFLSTPLDMVSPQQALLVEHVMSDRNSAKSNLPASYRMMDVLQNKNSFVSNYGTGNGRNARAVDRSTFRLPEINSVKYPATSQGSQRSSSSSSSSNGDVNWKAGQQIAGRYILEDQLGKGSFGQVFKCFDSYSNTMVAIKIIKNKKAFYEQGKFELQLLHHINKCDPHKKYIVMCLNGFTWTNHLCLVFELLGVNLYELLKRGGFRGLPMQAVRSISSQLLEVLSFLKTLGIIHCDLKPENILMVDETSFRVKVADMGSSCYLNSKPYKYIQSRFYRSPEVILELGYDHAIDMWSLGCIMTELFTGEALFRGSNEIDQLSCMIEVLGNIPKSMIQFSNKAPSLFFYDSLKDEYLLKNSTSIKVHRSIYSRPLSVVLSKGIIDNSASLIMPSECVIFQNLLIQALSYRPDERIEPDTALSHAFFDTIGNCTFGQLFNFQPSSKTLTISSDRSPEFYQKSQLVSINNDLSHPAPSSYSNVVSSSSSYDDSRLHFPVWVEQQSISSHQQKFYDNSVYLRLRQDLLKSQPSSLHHQNRPSKFSMGGFFAADNVYNKKQVSTTTAEAMFRSNHQSNERYQTKCNRKQMNELSVMAGKRDQSTNSTKVTRTVFPHPSFSFRSSNGNILNKNYNNLGVGYFPSVQPPNVVNKGGGGARRYAGSIFSTPTTHNGSFSNCGISSISGVNKLPTSINGVAANSFLKCEDSPYRRIINETHEENVYPMIDALQSSNCQPVSYISDCAGISGSYCCNMSSFVCPEFSSVYRKSRS